MCCSSSVCRVSLKSDLYPAFSLRGAVPDSPSVAGVMRYLETVFRCGYPARSEHGQDPGQGGH
jgi:hypothetical protein